LTDLPAELVDIIIGIIIDIAPRRDPYWIYKSSYLTGRLFKRVELSSPWQAYLFLTLAQKVRSLNFKLSSSSTSIAGSMGKGGGSAICGILRSCPLLKSITIDTAFLSSCKEPMMEALILHPQRSEDRSNRNSMVLEEMNARLSLRWDMLNTVELSQLSGRSFTMAEDIHKSIPVFNRALRTIALNDPDLDKRELYSLLVSSRESMRTLEILVPSSRLDRMGLFRILKDCASPDLLSLSMILHEDWHRLPDLPSSEGLDDPAQNPYLIDILFHSSFRKLKSLHIHGPIASSRLLSLLPRSIEEVQWCLESPSDIKFVTEVLAWRNHKGNKSPPPDLPADFEGCRPWLPNLWSFVIIEDWMRSADDTCQKFNRSSIN
ncbi:hypothetical protein PSHT_10748, partial [Puccinia striiformis]